MSCYATYILECADRSYYIGSTSNLRSRVQAHRSGKGPQHTALRLPVRLVYHELFDTLEEAVARESQLKRWTRAKKEALIAGDLARLKRS